MKFLAKEKCKKFVIEEFFGVELKINLRKIKLLVHQIHKNFNDHSKQSEHHKYFFVMWSLRTYSMKIFLKITQNRHMNHFFFKFKMNLLVIFFFWGGRKK